MAYNVQEDLTDMVACPSTSRRLPVDSADPIGIAESLSREFAATAVERDRRGGTPKYERDALRASGLLTLVVPKALGGAGASWATALQATRILARSDGALPMCSGFSTCSSRLCASSVRGSSSSLRSRDGRGSLVLGKRAQPPR
jgi:alkylation response protein AidB-like acyl-CoA dehydrogenase